MHATEAPPLPRSSGSRSRANSARSLLFSSFSSQPRPRTLQSQEVPRIAFPVGTNVNDAFKDNLRK
jgi:hypothetical protein